MPSRIILAADGLHLDQCLDLARKIGDRLYAIKIHDLYDEHGPSVVAQLRDAGRCRVWVDFKLHDIPKTVELRAAAIARSGADILTVHASGKTEMMKRAVDSGIPEVFAVTLLTSLNEEDVRAVYGQPPDQKVRELAQYAKDAGAHGIVCSALELSTLEGLPTIAGMKLVVPGVRSPGVDVNDQSRVDTPANAVANGASFLVVGRQVTLAEDPDEAINQLTVETSTDSTI